jgi:hypothetical protein
VKRDSDSTKQVAALDNNEIETQVSGSWGLDWCL